MAAVRHLLGSLYTIDLKFWPENSFWLSELFLVGTWLWEGGLGSFPEVDMDGKAGELVLYRVGWLI